MNGMKWFHERAEGSVTLARATIEEAKQKNMFGYVQLTGAPVYFDDECWNIEKEEPENKLWQFLLSERYDSGDSRALVTTAKLIKARYITDEPTFNLIRCLLLSEALDYMQNGLDAREAEASLEEAMEFFFPTDEPRRQR